MNPETTQVVHQCQCNICQAGNDTVTIQHHRQMNLFLSRLNEPQRRWYVGLLSQKPDNPSDRQLSLITGLDEETIRRGRRELEDELSNVATDHQRCEGGGRPSAEKKTHS
jgi:hypothetical protein